MTLVREIALQILHQNGLSFFLAHVINHQDNTLAKATKNLSEWTMQIQHELYNNPLQLSCDHTWAFPNGLQSYKEKNFWAAHVTSMVRLLCANFDNYTLVVELLGTLHNLSYLDLPSASFWRDISSTCMLKNFIERLLVPGVTSPDVLLNLIMLIRMVCTDEDTTLVFISSSSLVNFTIIMKELRHETDLVMQTILLISQLLRFNRMAEVTLGTEGKAF
jgi:hypothetical protein